MERILQLLNEMETQGLILRYAIGGGMAVVFYAPPIMTNDLDIYTLLPPTNSPIIVLTPLYQFLITHGGQPKGEYVEVDGLPVQFVVAYNELVEEAIWQAREITFGTTKTRVPTAEHLIAIKLQAGRDKDLWHVKLLLEHATIDEELLNRILKRHGLMERWEAFLSAGGR